MNQKSPKNYLNCNRGNNDSSEPKSLIPVMVVRFHPDPITGNFKRNAVFHDCDWSALINLALSLDEIKSVLLLITSSVKFKVSRQGY